MPRLQTALFDLDGTLIDSIRLILDSYHHTLTQHKLPARTDQDWLKGVGTPLAVQFAEWRESPEVLEALIATYREYNLKHHDSMSRSIPACSRRCARSRRQASRPDWSPAKTAWVRSGVSGWSASRP